MIPRIVRDRQPAERRRVRLQRIVMVVVAVTVMQIVADRRHPIEPGVADGRTMRTNTRITKIPETKNAPEKNQGSVRRQTRKQIRRAEKETKRKPGAAEKRKNPASSAS